MAWKAKVESKLGDWWQKLSLQEAIDDIMQAQQRANSAGPSASEYKDLIRQSLTTAGTFD